MKKVFASILLCAASPAVHALCTQYSEFSAESEFAESKFVIVASVVSRLLVVDPQSDPAGYEAEIFGMEVTQSLKGDPGNLLYVFSENTSARFPLVVGEIYLLFVRFDGSFNWVSNCGHSGVAAENAPLLSQLKSYSK